MAPPVKFRKLAIMGYRSVGKSSITIQFVENQFVESYEPTIENTYSYRFKVKNQEYDLKIVDTAGQDEHSLFPDNYTLDIDGYIIVYSVTSSKSFEVVKTIHDKLIALTGQTKFPVVLVGNKTDLHIERKILKEAGQQLAQSWNAHFIETSAMHNLDVRDIFKGIIFEIEQQDSPADKESKCVVS